MESLTDFFRRSTSEIYSDSGWYLLKNPGSLNNFDSNVRGVITTGGDLYLEFFSNAIHHDILKILYNKGIIKGDFKKSWSIKKPEENTFITVQRKDNTNIIGVGESNKLIYDQMGWDKLKGEYGKYMQIAHMKNPKIDFVNKLVRIKFNYLKTASNIDRTIGSTGMRNIIK